jgi:hypothetical protein
MTRELGELAKIALVFGLTVALATVTVAGKTGGKKHDTAAASMQNIRALVLDMQTQVGALGRLTDDPSAYSGEAAATAVGAEPRAKTYASERNGRLNDLRHKARLLETVTNRLRQQLEGRADAEVLKISRVIYQESKSLQATIERFPREPEATVDDVLVTRLEAAVQKLNEQARTIVIAYGKTP